MIDIAKLKAKRAALVAEMRTITADAEKRDDRKMTDEEKTKWDGKYNDSLELKSDIDHAERSNLIEIESADASSGDNRGSGEDEKNGFESLGEQLLAVRHASLPGATPDRRLIDVRATASGANESYPDDGGFLVGTDFLASIMKRAYESAILASRCMKFAIGANANGIKWNELKEASRANGSRWGGVQAYWTSEAGTVAATRPKFIKKGMDLEKIMALVYATEEMLQDSTALESIVNEVVPEEIAFKLDDAIYNGTGAGVPLGILSSDAFIEVAKEVGQTAASIVYENITKMWARTWAKSRANAAFFINQDCETELQSMALVVGTSGIPVYLPANGLSALPYATLMGRPVIPIEQASTCGTVGDLVIGDFSQYVLIDKGGVKKDVSMHVRFLYDEQVFRFTYRVNGQPKWSSALTPFKGTATLSPFVGLATRA